MLDISEKRRIGSVTQAACRSYSALTFDGCEACVDAALDATGQAAVYILGRAAPDMSNQFDGPVDMSYVLRIMLVDDMGKRLGSDEITVDQTISAVAGDDSLETDPQTTGQESDDEASGSATSMQLEDFQTVVDRLELAPAGAHGLCGSIAGHLYGYDRPIGVFWVEVTPGR
jgi:hypothetical protein